MQNQNQTQNTAQTVQFIINKTIEYCHAIGRHQDIKFDPKKAQTYMQSTLKERVKQIFATCKTEAETADIFEGLKTGKIHSLVKTTFQVTLSHECTMYAKDIVNNSLINPEKLAV